MREDLPRVARLFAPAVYKLFRRRSVWLFFSHSTKPWGGNSRAVCDAASNNPKLQKILIMNFGDTPSKVIESQYKSSHVPVHVYDRWTASSVWAALCADIIFVHEYSKYHMPNFTVNLWHGIPLKRIGQFQERLSSIKLPHFFRKRPKRRLKRPRSVNQPQRLISSSVHDHVVMTACFHLYPDRVLNCGLPRNDWLDPTFSLPSDLARDAARLSAMCGSRKLCLYAPTFRDEIKDWVPISRDQLQRLSCLLAAQGVVLGVRPHITIPQNFFDDLPECLDLSSSKFAEIQVLLRHSDMLITDYSSTALDFMLTKRPIVSFAPDLDEYSRGYLYSFRDVFPGPILRTFDDLLVSVEKIYTDASFRRECIQIADRVSHLFHEPGRRDISANLVEDLLLVRDMRLIESERS